MCSFCNSFDHPKNRCRFQNIWYKSETFRRRKDAEFREFKILRKDYLNLLAKDKIKTVNLVVRSSSRVDLMKKINEFEANTKDSIELTRRSVQVDPNLDFSDKIELGELLLEFENCFSLDEKDVGLYRT